MLFIKMKERLGQHRQIEAKYPSWAEEGKHKVPVYSISALSAEWAADEAKRKWGDEIFRHEQRYGNGEGLNFNGQKDSERTGWIELPVGSGVFFDRGKPFVVKHKNWWRIEDRDNNDPTQNVPVYAVYPVYVVKRDLSEEKEKISPPSTPEAVGCELEFSVGLVNESGAFLPVNIQEVVKEMKKRGVPVSIEGWISQLEIPSKPKSGDLRVSDHRRELVLDIFAVAETLGSLNCWLLPVSVMPFDYKGQANFENTHVRNVLMEGLKVAFGRELDIDEAADILGKYGVNGLHITVNLKEDDQGFVGDERLKKVFEKTHTYISLILKALTLNGNLGSVEDLKSDRLSYRDVRRKNLPTAQVGVVRRLYDNEVLGAVEKGLAPSLERASLCDKNGNVALGVHNLVGRQKETGRIEFTAFDIEPNIDKILALESLMSLFTTIVDISVLEGVDIYSDLDPYYKYLFGEFLYRQEEFDSLSEDIEKYGLSAVIKVQDEEKTAGEIVLEFIKWIEETSFKLGIVDDSTEEIERLRWLSEKLQEAVEGKIPEHFSDYFDPDNPHYAVGTVSEIARKRFFNLMNSGYAEEEAYNCVLRELAEEYRKHLLKLIEQSTGENSFLN